MMLLLKKPEGYGNAGEVRDTGRAAAQREGSGCHHPKPPPCPRCRARLVAVTGATSRLQEDLGIWGLTPRMEMLSTAGLGSEPKGGGNNPAPSTGEDRTQNATSRCPERLEKAWKSRKTHKSERNDICTICLIIPPFTEEDVGHGTEASHIKRYFEYHQTSPWCSEPEF